MLQSAKALPKAIAHHAVSAARAAELVAKHLGERLGAAGAQILNSDFHFSPPIRVLSRATGQILLLGLLGEVFVIEQ
jgi:hypothetical protein